VHRIPDNIGLFRHWRGSWASAPGDQHAGYGKFPPQTERLFEFPLINAFLGAYRPRREGRWRALLRDPRSQVFPQVSPAQSGRDEHVGAGESAEVPEAEVIGSLFVVPGSERTGWPWRRVAGADSLSRGRVEGKVKFGHHRKIKGCVPLPGVW